MSNNLLSKPPLSPMTAQAQLYLVYDNKDYRASLAAVLALVTKASVGLSNVDNTSDLNKPISTLTQQALDTKAVKSEVPSLTAFDQLAASLQNYVKQADLDQIIENLLEVISARVTGEELETALSSAIQPLSTGLFEVSERLEIAEQKIAALESDATTYVKQSAYNTAIQTLVNDWNTSFSNLSNATSASVQQLQSQISAISQSVVAINQALASKADTPIQLSDIEGLESWVRDVIAEASVVWMVGDW